MIRFKGADLRPVLAETAANKCRLVLVKEVGVYFLSEIGEHTPEGHQKVLAYAVGCNPDVDEFEDWWDLACTGLGAADFLEYFSLEDDVFARIISSDDDLKISATRTRLLLQSTAPDDAGS